MLEANVFVHRKHSLDDDASSFKSLGLCIHLSKAGENTMMFSSLCGIMIIVRDPSKSTMCTT